MNIEDPAKKAGRGVSGAYVAALTLTMAASLTACGGGGGDAGDRPSNPPPAATYAVGGTVAGLTGTLVLQNNGSNDLTVTSNGSFQFPVKLSSGQTYAVAVLSQPAGQQCTVTSGIGVINSVAIAGVEVNCSATTASYRIGGTVSGITEPVVLTLNGSESLQVSGNGSFQFAATLQTGAAYSIAIAAPPAGQSCTVASGTGTVGNADVGSIAVTCQTNNGSGGSAGNVSTLAGSGMPGHSDGVGDAASFDQPGCLAIDPAGNIFVPEYNHGLIRRVTPSGEVTTYAGSGTTGHVDGVGTAARFAGPAAVALDAQGNLYVAENLRVRKIAPDRTVTTFAGGDAYGVQDGVGAAAQFATPAGIAVHPATGDIYVADRNAHNIRRITPDGNVTTLAGTGQMGFTDGSGNQATFDGPRCVAFDSGGNLIVADTDNQLIRRVTITGETSTVAGSGGYGAHDGSALTATFANPHGIAIDPADNIYVGDLFNNLVRKISKAGEVSTFAGTGVAGSADGPASTATFWLPSGVVYDALNHRLVEADSFTALIRIIEVH